MIIGNFQYNTDTSNVNLNSHSHSHSISHIISHIVDYHGGQVQGPGLMLPLPRPVWNRPATTRSPHQSIDPISFQTQRGQFKSNLICLWYSLLRISQINLFSPEFHHTGACDFFLTPGLPPTQLFSINHTRAIGFNSHPSFNYSFLIYCNSLSCPRHPPTLCNPLFRLRCQTRPDSDPSTSTLNTTVRFIPTETEVA